MQLLLFCLLDDHLQMDFEFPGVAEVIDVNKIQTDLSWALHFV